MPKLMTRVPHLRGDILVLKIFTNYQVPTLQKIRLQKQEVAYLMGDTSGIEFDSVFCGQRRTILE